MLYRRLVIALFGLAILSLPVTKTLADWPQWRGPNRDGKVADFKVPATWPAELKQQWDVIVGDGVATPALVGDRLYVHTREGSDEVVRCLDATTGKEIWKDSYAARGADGSARGFPGPRCSPAVGEGKVVTLGAAGMLSCYDAESGKKLWNKDDFKSYPRFYTSASPIIADGLAIAQLGGDNNGTVAAYDLATGEQKWKWTGAPTSYASPMLMTVDGTKLVIGQVGDGLVAINAADGKHVWEMFFEGGGSRYKAATPIITGDTLIYSDGPARAVKLAKEGEKIVSSKLWSNQDSRVEYNTPVLRNGLLFGLTGRSELFCVDTKDGKTLWSKAIAPTPAGSPPAAAPPGGAGGGKGKGRGGGFGGTAGYGSIIDAGSVLIALTPSSQLVVYEPSDKEFKQLASYKIADKATYAHPIVTGNRIFVKDADSVTLWTVE
jgi:outer membrane protein assembly factor BamB